MFARASAFEEILKLFDSSEASIQAIKKALEDPDKKWGMG